MEVERPDYDAAWKEFITVFFREFVQLMLSDLDEMIDWTQPPQFLDNELRKLARESETGKLLTDRLVKVWLKNGDPRGVLLHFEAQSQYQSALEERVFTYYARLWLELRMDIASIVILGDSNPRWHPRRYVRELAGTRLDFRFRTIKLLDLDEAFLSREAEKGNPAALMLLAFRRAIGAANDVQARFEARKQLISLMWEHGYNVDDRAQLLRLMEWVLMLPDTLERQVEEFIEEYKREMDTPFVSRLERQAIQKGIAEGFAEGRAEGLRNALSLVLSRRFGEETAAEAQPALERLTTADTLQQLLDLALTALDSQTVIDALQQAASEQSAD
ncbi:MAG: hypothetical protein N2554_02545 [Fimbriimonadales bacterium]|nr:hypothetical protein [Fimbriimonadales bacterium]